MKKNVEDSNEKRSCWITRCALRILHDETLLHITIATERTDICSKTQNISFETTYKIVRDGLPDFCNVSFGVFQALR